MVDTKRVYTWKVDEHGWVVKAKSKLVARGFKQREGVDFSETFAPTVSSSYVCLLSAIACEYDLDLCPIDDQAFVQSYLEEDVFLRLPKGCGGLSGKIVRLDKSLYGLKQASRMACSPNDVSKKTRFRAMHDRCMCFPFDRGWMCGSYSSCARYVDDIFAVGQKERCDRSCVDLNRNIPVKNLGELKWYGGCRYSRDRERGTLMISQQSFAEELVKKFRVTSVQSVPLRPFLTRKFFQEILGLEGSQNFLGKFRQVHNLKISDRNKSFFQENIPGFIYSIFRSARGGDGVGWEDADGRVSDG